MESDESKLHGWHPDPTGDHEARYFSNGKPTRLVRDGLEYSHDNTKLDKLVSATVGLRKDAVENEAHKGEPDFPGSVQSQLPLQPQTAPGETIGIPIRSHAYGIPSGVTESELYPSSPSRPSSIDIKAQPANVPNIAPPPRQRIRNSFSQKYVFHTKWWSKNRNRALALAVCLVASFFAAYFLAAPGRQNKPSLSSADPGHKIYQSELAAMSDLRVSESSLKSTMISTPKWETYCDGRAGSGWSPYRGLETITTAMPVHNFENAFDEGMKSQGWREKLNIGPSKLTIIDKRDGVSYYQSWNLNTGTFEPESVILEGYITSQSFLTLPIYKWQLTFLGVPNGPTRNDC